MMSASPASFSHPAWMRAVLAQLPDAHVLVDGTADSPFAYHALRRRRFPLPHAESYVSPLTPCPLPSAETVPSEAQARAYLDRLATPLVLRGVRVDHPVTQTLLKAASHSRILNQWQRAGLDVTGTFEAWMMENFDHKRRKELKRLKARLAEQGDLVLESLSSDDDLSPHLDAFLALEAAGWKGRRGSAIALDPGLTSGLRQGLAAMQALGKVRFWTFRLAGKPIASLYALVDGGEAVLGKIAYDETLARYSPGVLLIIEATSALFADPAVTRADANAIPDHPMIDRLWRGRVACMDVAVAGAVVNSFTFSAVSRATGTKDAMRALIKRIYLRITGRRPS